MAEELAKMQMKNEADKGTGGGRSMTAVFIPDSDPDVTTYAVQRVRDYINVFVPGNTNDMNFSKQSVVNHKSSN